jgi:hypothetical protein
MLAVLHDLDRLLRGDFTRPRMLRLGRIDVPWLRLVMGGLLCGAFYGTCMGLWAASHNKLGGVQPAWVASGAVKVPLLFLCTLLVTFPSLYVFSALANGCLRLGATLRLLLGAVGVQMALLAGFAPITVFFTMFTRDYAFMVALNVFFFGLSGFISLGFLARAVRIVFSGDPDAPAPATDLDEHVTADDSDVGAGGPEDTTSDARLADSDAAINALPDAPPAAGDKAEPMSSLDAARARHPAVPWVSEPDDETLAAHAGDARARRVFRVWLVIYGVVGAQMGWVLRPFIGDPAKPFAFSRDPEGHVFTGLASMLRSLFGG